MVDSMASLEADYTCVPLIDATQDFDAVLQNIIQSIHQFRSEKSKTHIFDDSQVSSFSFQYNFL